MTAPKLYKYARAEILSKQFAEPGQCNFKCSKPKEFNDPYELFLTVEFDQDPEFLAYYRELIGEIPQYPTTCFSKSPAVVPMWAHYGDNHQGVVIEIDESKLKQRFPNLAIEDVDYRQAADPELSGLLQHAVMTRKARHAMFLMRGVAAAAYFTKHDSWHYEQERRVVDQQGYAKEGEGHIILPCPTECVTTLIVGSRAANEIRSTVRALAERVGCAYYEMKVARSTAQPYFVSVSGEVHVFDGSGIVGPRPKCEKCGEPARGETSLCAWCAVTGEHEEEAAGSNMLRAAADAGLLEGYLQDFNAVSDRACNKQ